MSSSGNWCTCWRSTYKRIQKFRGYVLHNNRLKCDTFMHNLLIWGEIYWGLQELMTSETRWILSKWSFATWFAILLPVQSSGSTHSDSWLSLWRVQLSIFRGWGTMSSKLEYRFLQITKIAVVVLDVSVGVVVPALDNSCMVDLVLACWWWDRVSTTFSNSSIFQSPIPMQVWILDFPIHQKSLLIAQNSSNRQFLSSKLLLWKLENPKISQFTQKSPDF
jgi:hypothetical protein